MKPSGYWWYWPAVWRTRSSGSRLISRMKLAPSSTKPSSAPSISSDTSASRTVSSVKCSSNRRMKGPMAQEPLLSLALPSKQGAAPFDVAQVDVVAQGGAQHLAAAVDGQDDLGLRVVPGGRWQQAHLRAAAHRRHRLRLGKHFRIGADAHFHVLRPGAALLQLLFQALRRVRTRLQCRQVAAQCHLQGGAQARRARRVAARLLLDHPFEQADGEGHAAGLDGLQVARRQQQRLAGRRGQRLLQQRLHGAERDAGRMADDIERIAAFEQLGHRRHRLRDVDHFAAAHGDDAGTVTPDAADEGGLRQVGGQQRGGGNRLHGKLSKGRDGMAGLQVRTDSARRPVSPQLRKSPN